MSSLAQVVGLQRWPLQHSICRFRASYATLSKTPIINSQNYRFYSSNESEKQTSQSQNAVATNSVEFGSAPVKPDVPSLTSFGHEGYAVPSSSYRPEVNASTAYTGGPPKLLMRDFVHQSLYHPTKGYFSSSRPPVGRFEDSINYFKIYSRDEYSAVVDKRYKELEVAFLTPVELFTPWYGSCLARHIHELTKFHPQIKSSIAEDEPLVIYEVGGGNGTLAKDVLNWLRDNKPEQYARTTYTCIEISPSLAAEQFHTVIERAGHRGHFRVLRGNALDRDVWGARDHAHCFVLMMEVLDNLPHDRVARARLQDPWRQTVVRAVRDGDIENGPWFEEEEELSDPLLMRALKSSYEPPTTETRLDEKIKSMLDFILAREHEHRDGGNEVLFVPSTAQAFFELLHDCRPNHSLIAADFDKLPDVRVPGRNAPLVAQKVAGHNIDHDSVLVPWGCADIFYPTDFDALCRMYHAANNYVWGSATKGKRGPNRGAQTRQVTAEHYRQGSVLMRYREMFHTHTMSNYNPMVDDFINARFFLGHSWGCVGPKLEKYMPPEGLAAIAAAAAAAATTPVVENNNVRGGVNRHPAQPESPSADSEDAAALAVLQDLDRVPPPSSAASAAAAAATVQQQHQRAQPTAGVAASSRSAYPSPPSPSAPRPAPSSPKRGRR